MGFSQKQRNVLMVCVCIWITSSLCAASLLVPHEVSALHAIAKELGKTDWNFAVDPCTSNDTTWTTIASPTNPTYDNQLNCSCSGDVCHVISISLQGQDLQGVIPPSMAKLKHLQHIVLARNYLNGTIPPKWASLASLNHMSLSINRLSGPLPAYLGNMTNLTYLSIESNMFSGNVPAELGNLVNLQKLNLNANYFTGKLPKALTNLTNLIELEMSSNNFSGKMPNYFPSWTALQTLEIQGSGFSGPIPSTIANLTALTNLGISDLPGEGSGFPDVRNMKNLTNLILRNCKLSGPIPENLADLPNLRSLDLSYNNLVGPIPELNNIELRYLYLTNNFLTGSIPDWITSIGEYRYIDLSYNNLNKSSLPSSCNKNNLNLYRSSSRDLNSSLAPCLDQDFACSSHDRYSLHINCGGKRTKVGKNIRYEADDDTGGPAKFVPNRAEWGYSNTGHFWDKNNEGDYIATNVYDNIQPPTDADLYTKARISALSLTYYGRCLATGNYTVVLYFAEILFTNNNSFHSLGRRFFDIYVQEKLVKQNFDIVKVASGAERACNVTVPNVIVTETGTVEIRFQYAGGTTNTPTRGTYGTLVSAISVHSEFNPPLEKKTIIEIAVGSSVSLILLAIISYCTFVWRWRKKNLPSREEVLQGIDLQTSLFTYLQIKVATDNFNPANKIGEGGFGSVYRGTLLDGTYIAVKRLSSESSQGNKEFVNEIGMISSLHHPNLVRLYGCCVEGPQLFLVYEYMVNNNLARALFDEDWTLRLDWPTRQKVCTELARGLVFLHEDSTVKIIHRDIKPTNVLLDENLNAKISDFGLARLREEEHSHISTKVAGTMGYMSPEYALWGYLTYKADVYSFGVVALEIVVGRSNMDFVPNEDNFCLLDCATVKEKRGELMSMVDAKLGDEYNKEEAMRMIKIALLCTNASPALRPTMSQVVRMLEGNLSVEDAANNYFLVRQPHHEHWAFVFPSPDSGSVSLSNEAYLLA